MRAIVDQDTCTGCGLCTDCCPEVFEMDGATARVKTDPVPAGSEAACREALVGCPVDAISIEE
ncbi:MAG: ferredoxin [Kiritimatiellae bacterium]|nr:ferredoxin [Kiritimatiellia bacterium]